MIGRTNSGAGGGGVLGGAAVLTVNAPASVTTTVSKGDKVFTKSSGSTGIVKFGGLSTGTWNVKIDGNGQTRNQNVSITADYSTTIRFFKATINITYPVGSTVTATLGSLVLRAPNTSGTWACKVPQAGTWVIKSTLGSESDQKNAVISSDGQTVSVSLAYNKIPAFTYTGNYQIVDDNDSPITTSKGNWKIRFLTSGTLTFTDLRGAANGIDIFLVGGGGNTIGGGSTGYGGGGGGYTKTVKNVSVSKTNYTITIGGGDGKTSAFGVTANAGGSTSSQSGGAGGSGGGRGGSKSYDSGSSGGRGGDGGSDGGDGGGGAKGQGTTTREFGEAGGKLYAGGGGGGTGWGQQGYAGPSSGGSGGGGRGAGGNSGPNVAYRPTSGATNTGGGAGGGANGTSGATGGSGIVVIRNAR